MVGGFYRKNIIKAIKIEFQTNFGQHLYVD